MAKIAFTLEGPTEEKGFAFIGKTADAEKWIIKFADGVQVPIFAPKAPTAGYHNHTVQEMANSAALLPKGPRSKMTRIVLNPITNPEDPYWATQYGMPDFHSYMTAGEAGVVTVYPDKDTKALPTEDLRAGRLVHETGHTWSYKTWGTDTTKNKWIDWKAAMDSDQAAVSAYAKANIKEDVAETIAAYITTKGSPRYQEYRRIVPARFAILDAEYK
jgi:hypothetical protein